MKSFASIFLLFIYGFSTAGTLVRFHFCMGHYSNWSLSDGLNGNCEKCGMAKNKSHACCKDVIKQIKIKNVHQAGMVSYDIKKFDQPVISPVLFHPYSKGSFTNNKIRLLTHSPPTACLTERNILYCLLLI